MERIYSEVGNLPSVKTCQRTKIQNGSIADDRILINLKSLMGSDDLYTDVDADEVKNWKKMRNIKALKNRKGQLQENVERIFMDIDLF